MNPSDVLLISGLPGTGKSVYTAWLERQGWGCLRSDDIDGRDLRYGPAFRRAVLEGEDDHLLDMAAEHAAGFVIEWGFPVTRLDELEAMIGRGYLAWYFDGNPQAAFASWGHAKSRTPADVEGCRQQLSNLDACRETLRRLYPTQMLYTVRQGPKGPRHTDERTIHRRLWVSSYT